MVPIGKVSLFTSGAYTCYAGVAQSPKSGLFLFHLYEKNARMILGDAIGGDPIAGVYGGTTLQEKRKGSNEFASSAMTELQPKHSSLGGFNILVLPSHEILYSSGRFDNPE